MAEIIIKQNTRILTPREYSVIRENLKKEHKIILDAQLFTAMRQEEFRKFVEHPEWFKLQRHAIDLPKAAILKEKCRFKERTIMLSTLGVASIERLFDSVSDIPTRAAWNGDLTRACERASIATDGIAPKMTRKTYISWLVAQFPQLHLLIASSAGHSINVMQEHYLGIAFTPVDLEEMKQYTSGWFK
jgi:integrase